MNRHVLSRAFWLAGWEGGEKGEAQRVMGQLVCKPGGHTWKGAEGRVQSRKSPGPVPGTPEMKEGGGKAGEGLNRSSRSDQKAESIQRRPGMG